MLNNAAARYHLRQDRVMIPQKSTNRQLMGWVDTTGHDQVPGTSALIELLAPPCREGHLCLGLFRQSPQAARNWRVLWRSSPPSARREKLIELMVKQLQEYRDGQDMREWRLEFALMGIPVCRAAFMRVTGIGASSLTKARPSALSGHASSLSRQELGMNRLMLGRNHPPLYLDARQWLEHYADTNGEQSPMDCLTFLPAGRKQFYYAQYASARAQQGLTPASLHTFQLAWRIDVSWLAISRTICKFSKCGVCEYLKWLIDQTPRTKRDVMQMYLARLGQHFDFQGAQRLAVARVEETCRQSGNTKWLMLIDKMDQNAAKLPTEWHMVMSAFSKRVSGCKCPSMVLGFWSAEIT